MRHQWMDHCDRKPRCTAGLQLLVRLHCLVRLMCLPLRSILLLRPVSLRKENDLRSPVVHLTGGYAPRFQAFSLAQTISVKVALPCLSRQQVTQAVGRSSVNPWTARTVSWHHPFWAPESVEQEFFSRSTVTLSNWIPVSIELEKRLHHAWKRYVSLHSGTTSWESAGAIYTRESEKAERLIVLFSSFLVTFSPVFPI